MPDLLLLLFFNVRVGVRVFHEALYPVTAQHECNDCIVLPNGTLSSKKFDFRTNASLEIVRTAI